MDRKPKAGGAKKPPSKAKKEEKSQAERFIETARQIGVDETGGEFERALRKIVPPRKTAR